MCYLLESTTSRSEMSIAIEFVVFVKIITGNICRATTFLTLVMELRAVIVAQRFRNSIAVVLHLDGEGVGVLLLLDGVHTLAHRSNIAYLSSILNQFILGLFLLEFCGNV